VLNKFKLFWFAFLLLITFLGAETQTFFVDSFRITSEEKHQPFLRETFSQVNDRIDKFERKIGRYPDYKVDVIVAKTKAEYQSFATKSKVVTEFSSAFFNLKTRKIYLAPLTTYKNQQELIRVIHHEFIHFYVSLYFPNAPLWFHEGMAVYFSEGLNFIRASALTSKRIMGKNITIDKMRTYPKNKDILDYYYSLSAYAVQELYNNDKQDFLKFWGYAPGNFNTIFFKTYLRTPKEYSNQLEQTMDDRLPWFVLSFLLGIGGIIYPLLFLFAHLKKVIKNYKIKKKWEKEPELEVTKSITTPKKD
jgi:hypothetical protein